MNPVLQALLRRLEKRLSAAGVTSDGAQSLLRQLSPSAPAGRKLERYPVRVMLCAYMIKEHPEVVFNSVVSRVPEPVVADTCTYAFVTKSCVQKSVLQRQCC